MTNTIEIGRPEITISDNKCIYEVAIDNTLLWYSIPKQHQDTMTDRADAALVTLIQPAMLAGRNLHVVGAISQKLYYNASGPLQAALRSVNPRLQQIRVSADRIVRPNGARGVATGFSGGVDSFSVVSRHFLNQPTRGFEITHLTVHDIYTDKNFVEFNFSKLPKGLQNIELLAGKWGLPLIPVSSNVGAHYQGWRFEDSHTLRNASVAHVLSEGIGRYFYASGYPMAIQSLQKSGGYCASRHHPAADALKRSS